MCGRYVQARGADDLLAWFEAESGLGATPVPPDYNIAPTDPVPIVVTRRRSGDRAGPVVRQIRLARWGLVPSWAGDAAGAARKINARAETVRQLPAFRAALARRRCLLPADGWYEWTRRDDGRRQPYFMTSPDGTGLAFAGLYEFWTPPGAGDADRLTTATIITTAAVGELAGVHDRMPLLLPRSAWAGWLDPTRDDPAGLLDPPAADLVAGLELRPVGAAVGNVNNDGPGLIEPVSAAIPQTLF